MSSDYVLQANVKVGQHLINITGSDTDTFKANLQWTTENAAGIVAAAVALEGGIPGWAAGTEHGKRAGEPAAATAGIPAGRCSTAAAVPAAAAATRQRWRTSALLCPRCHEACARWHQQEHGQGL